MTFPSHDRKDFTQMDHVSTETREVLKESIGENVNKDSLDGYKEHNALKKTTT